MTQRPSILGSGRRSRAGKMGLIKCRGYCGAWRDPVTSGGASKPRPRAWHLGQKLRSAETQTSCHSCTPCQAWRSSTAAGVAAASPRAPVLAPRAGPACVRHSASQCEQEAGLVSALARAISRGQLHVHRPRALCFFLFRLLGRKSSRKP